MSNDKNVSTTESKNLVKIKSLADSASEANIILRKEEAYMSFLDKKIDQVKVTNAETKDKAIKIKDSIKAKVNEWREERKDFTRSLDKIKKLFTTNENSIMEYVDKIDIQLNGYAKKLHEEQKKREAEHAKKRAAREELANAQVLMSQRVDHLIRQTHQYMKVEVKKINNKEDAEKLRKRIGSGVKWSDAYEKKMLEHGAGVSSSVWKDLYKKRKDEIVDRYKKECNEVWEDLDQNIELQIENAKEAAKVIAAAEKEHEERKQKEREEEKKALEVEAVLAEIDDKGPIDESIRVKKKINILNMSGAVALVNFWYTDDPNAEKENWDRRTFAQCKRYCEKRRNQDDKIFEHEGFEWVDEVSAK